MKTEKDYIMTEPLKTDYPWHMAPAGTTHYNRLTKKFLTRSDIAFVAPEIRIVLQEIPERERELNRLADSGKLPVEGCVASIANFIFTRDEIEERRRQRIEAGVVESTTPLDATAGAKDEWPEDQGNDSDSSEDDLTWLAKNLNEWPYNAKTAKAFFDGKNKGMYWRGEYIVVNEGTGSYELKISKESWLQRRRELGLEPDTDKDSDSDISENKIRGKNMFEQEHRYWVFKRKNINKEQDYALSVLAKECPQSQVECVVVESDWPNYQATWDAIEAIANSKDSSDQAEWIPEVGTYCEYRRTGWGEEAFLQCDYIGKNSSGEIVVWDYRYEEYRKYPEHQIKFRPIQTETPEQKAEREREMLDEALADMLVIVSASPLRPLGQIRALLTKADELGYQLVRKEGE